MMSGDSMMGPSWDSYRIIGSPPSSYLLGGGLEDAAGLFFHGNSMNCRLDAQLLIYAIIKFSDI